MDLHLKDKRALITGGSRGIGKAIADILAEEGCSVILASRSADDLAAAAGDILARFGTAAETHAVDLSRAKDLDLLARAAGDVDILVNNAGAIPAARFLDLDEAATREAWELKLFGYMNLTRRIYPNMQARRSGVILNIIGTGALARESTYVAGSMANSALEAFTVSLGKESPEFGVRVVGIHPYGTLTDRFEQQWRRRARIRFDDEERWRELIPDYPFGRPAEPAEVADMAAFLVSDRAKYTSGVVMLMTGDY